MKTMRVDAGSERTINSETESLNKTKANDAISRARLAKDDAAKIK